MKNSLMFILTVSLLGCTSVPDDMPPRKSGGYLLDSGKYHEAFLYWPIWEKDVKNEPEGAHGLAYYLLIYRTANTGQKDWCTIFKDPEIPFCHKDKLLTMIHEIGIKDDNCWDEIDLSVLLPQLDESKGERQYASDGKLHDKILAYLEHSSSIADKEAAIQLFSRHLEVPWALHAHTNKGESEFPFILMDYRIPLSIKENLMYLLHIRGQQISSSPAFTLPAVVSPP